MSTKTPAGRGFCPAVDFSNGQTVEFAYVVDGDGSWWVDRLGPGAGRGLLQG
ncbi:MAG TPA: hypothetical protein VH247_03050 [Thermoleophilaceae bacterium]|nr:hypothetical protein [Thermoleophilaceae bacterium]